MAEWNHDRLAQMIRDKVEEHNQLDYKAAASLDRDSRGKTEITKDVSAFANSNGGTIVYGIKEFSDKERRHLPEKIDAVDGRAFSKEWLDQIIGQIQPRIGGIVIHPIRVGPNEADTCYVVEIPRGETAHQANDLKYYRRYNFESVPMQDYEIRDLMWRQTQPRLDLRVRLFKTLNSSLKVNACVKNVGSVIPRRYGTLLLLPEVIGGRKYYTDGLRHHSRGGHSYWRLLLEGKEPAFPQSDAYSEFEIELRHDSSGDGQHEGPATFFCTLYADEMQPVKREISVSEALKDWV